MGAGRNCRVCGRWTGTNGAHACAPKAVPPTPRMPGTTAFLTDSTTETDTSIAELYRTFQETQDAPVPPTDLLDRQLATTEPSLDELQRASIADAVNRRYDRYPESRMTAPGQEQWNEFVQEQARAVEANDRLDEATRAELARQWRALDGTEPPDGKTFSFLNAFPKKVRRARWALKDQAASIAAWRGVSDRDVSMRYQMSREAYLGNAAADPAAYEVPEEYAKAFRRTANGAPTDPATVYGFYTAEHSDYLAGTPRRYVALDLETTGISPTTSHIIEIGTVTYDEHGNEVGRWSTLIRPPAAEDGTLNTGPVEVHGITPDDVQGAPDFAAVLPEIRSRLDGAVLIGHNLKFDTIHLRMTIDKYPGEAPADGEPAAPRYPWSAEADTMVHAVRHIPGLSDYKLVTVSGHVGVPYTNGHRAEHDAAVAGETFFRLRKPLLDKVTTDDPWASN